MARRPLILSTLILVVSALAACEVPVVPDPTGASTAPSSTVGTAVAGPRDGRIIGDAVTFPRNGESVVPSPTASFGPITLGALEAAIAGAEVVILDAAKNPIPGFKPVKTDAGGRFVLQGLPEGHTYVVEVRPADGSRPLRSLVSTVPGGESVIVSPASTIATAMLTIDLHDVPPAHDARSFQRLIHEIALYTTPAEFDLYTEDRQLAAKVGAIAAGSAEVWSMLEGLKRDITGAPTATAEIAAKLGGVVATPTPGPTTTATTTAGPTTNATPIATATPSPSASATSSPTPAPTPSGVGVSTVAGNGAAGFANGVSTAAAFNIPQALALDAGGSLFVADEANHRVRKITLDGGSVSTLAGKAGSGDADGTGEAAAFNNPRGLDYDAGSGKVYVADFSNRTIRVVSPDGAVTTLLKTDGTKLTFGEPADVALGPGGLLFVSDQSTNRIMRVALDGNGRGTATVAAGSADGLAGFLDGAGTTAKFDRPRGLEVDSAGNVYVADSFNHRIRKLTVNGDAYTVSTVAGSGDRGTTNGTATSARLSEPSGISFAPDGSLYIADAGNHQIRKLLNNQVTTVAGSGVQGWQDGSFLGSRFSAPRDVLAASNKKLYVADTGGQRIRVVTLP